MKPSKKDFLQDHEMMGASALLGSSVGGPQDFIWIVAILIRLFGTCQMHVNAKCLQCVQNCDLVPSLSIFSSPVHMWGVSLYNLLIFNPTEDARGFLYTL